MPTLKRRKDGEYFVHAPGDDNPVNTFQLTTRGAEIVERSGRSVGDFFPDRLFFLLYDLGHLSTTGTGNSVELDDAGPFDEPREGLSDRERVRVAVAIAEGHGVDELYRGRPAAWVCSLFELPADVLTPLVRTVADAAGFSYETIAEYEGTGGDRERYLEIALALYLQSYWLREFETIDDTDGRADRNVLGTEGEYVYVSVPEPDVFELGTPGGMPEFVDDDLEGELRPVWGEGIGAAGFAALHSIEVGRRYDGSGGVVVPTSRLQDVVDLPDRSELTELCEAVRLLNEAVDRVLASPDAGVTHGDGSACDRWARDIEERRIGDGSDDAPPLTTQQRSRVDHSIQKYRDCYGDGTRVTDFGVVELARPSESEQLRLFGFGIFDHGEEIRVPVAPDSGTPLPVYPQSANELDRARELLDEFPARPRAGTSR